MTYFVIIGISLIYSIVLNIVYFKKVHVKTRETHYYSIILVTNLVGLFAEGLCTLIGYTSPINSILPHIFTKIFIIYLTFFTFFMTLYIYSLCLSDKPKLFNKFRIILITSLVLSIITIIYLPIATAKGYATGASVNFVYTIGIIFISLTIIPIIYNRKKINMKKVIPFFAFVLFNIIISIIQKYNPTITITTSMECLITFIMYFTIENPDLKMLEELSKAQILSEQTNDEKSNFLYIVNDVVNNNLNTAEKIYQNVNKLNPSPEIKLEMEDLKNLVDISRVKIKQTLDVSELDSRMLYPVNTKYDLKLLINSIYLQLKQNVNNNIDFRLNIIGNIPKELYGDSIKIKQVLTTIITNSIKYTKSGFIEFRVNSIIKFDACRLIFTIEDSGIGMSLLKQNEILSNHEELTPEELNEKDNINLNLKMIRKIINIIGGTYTIDSNEDKGTVMRVTIDQKIVKEEQSNEEKAIEKYSNELKNKQRVAIISTNNDELKVIKKALKKFDINTETFIETLPCLTNIRNNICYDVIFIDENMNKIDAESFLYKVKMVEGYKTRIIVITPSKDFNHKKELISKGFSNVITLPINRDEIRNKIIS